MDQSDLPWWKTSVFYQIYPRSFQDSNGDGFGDIPGIVSRLDELAALGVGCLWLSPLYPSPDADNGYDIADYCAIDPRYGTLDDFDQLVNQAGARGIRIIMDLVVNHTSDEHRWFQASRRRQDPYSDYYIWRPSGPAGDPPNNWTGFFMGSTWEWDPVRGEFYLHLFDKKQPDLNWNNPAVLAEIEDVLRFWLDRGVAGFRCDVITCLFKTSLEDGKGLPIVRGLEHYKTQPGLHDILRSLRRDVLDPYGAFTVGEAAMVTLDEGRELTDPSRGELDLIFYFNHLEVDHLFSKYGPKPFSAKELMRRLTVWQQGLHWNALYLENHDQPRIVSHYGNDQAYWLRSAKLFAVLLMTLRGSPFIYQGQEIGMTNFDFTSIDELDDVESRNTYAMFGSIGIPKAARWAMIRQSSRDNARTPVQWDASEGAGFTTGAPWLRINRNSQFINYALQEQDPDSVLSFYRQMVKLRADSPTLLQGDFTPVHANRALMVYRREAVGDMPSVTVYLNIGDHAQPLNGPWATPLLQCGTSTTCLASNTGRTRFTGPLVPWEAVVIQASAL
ncbi:MAG: alpha-glucosidase [Propionibacteriaceae bacterium]|nr:alpha-glucosidase [Propionibacteriaceae bacterium]